MNTDLESELVNARCWKYGYRLSEAVLDRVQGGLWMQRERERERKVEYALFGIVKTDCTSIFDCLLKEV